MTNNTPKNSFLFLLYLSLLSIIGFLATDMSLPAFDAMQNDFEASRQSIGATLSLYLAGFAIAQLFWGPLSDKYGNLKAISWGLTIFTLTSIGIYFVEDIVVLLILRVVQAIGVCAAAVCWQALVMERYPKEKTHKVFASIMPLVALSPALAPVAGAYLMKGFSWRIIFIVLGVLALVLLIYTRWEMRKSTVESTNATPKESISYLKFFNSLPYLGNVLLYGLCSAGFFAWLTGAPFFLHEMGFDAAEIGLSFVPQTIAFMAGGYIYRWISDKISGDRLLPLLLWLYGISIFFILLFCYWGEPTLLLLLLPFCAMAFSNGACYPIVVDRALKYFPKSSGKAAALQNTIQLGICFVASTLVALFADNALLATAWVMVGTVPPTILAYRWTKKKGSTQSSKN